MQVVAEKRLVKELQKEVARLEAELYSPNPSSSTCLKTLLEEKEFKIQQVCQITLGAFFHNIASDVPTAVEHEPTVCIHLTLCNHRWRRK